ncbi:leucine-tRNA ligase [Verruconis gallopava]|uniref:leucine--tRNA ligase n=1 Tax=Verruconis gallopava TaxID=253628 RepID=A0A0D2APP4_9PEZI|nr:leucine-tRNA ligase [Verruconis gallopava]KIW01134.1 leucine-tRNA ligase [Verruconis gallopava]
MAPNEPVPDSTLKIENTEKRDTLVEIEKKYQKKWQDDRVFEADAPTFDEFPIDITNHELHSKVPKFFGTMAYPYTNGLPHLGHGYTMSKIEFQARASRHLGKRTLFPQGFHVTGMPIKAAADKIKNEVAMFGKNFENAPKEDDEADDTPVPAPTQNVPKTDVTKFKNTKRGKAALKGAGARYQFQTMLSMGVPIDEIHKFADSVEWVKHFPQLWRRDMTALGCSIDWRRQFCTTDLNPYYNSFVEWQMRKLKASNLIQFGKRYTVYSPKDGQACLDHDRSQGEGVNPQEYLALKCQVAEWSETAKAVVEDKLPQDAKVYLVAATLRPETMYGQSNLFVSPQITYGIFKGKNEEYYLITKRAARNMAYQSIFENFGEVKEVFAISGKDVIGTQVHAPLSHLGKVYVVPMDTIKENKGTGVVTSVPSDSPDDFVMNRDLAKKPDFYGIQQHWVPTEHLPIIESPTHGNLIAKSVVEKAKIASPKDTAALALAKEEAYKEGFYKGKMLVGECAGKPVQEAKEIIRKQLIDSGDGFPYSEPDGLVISRSGDECVSALLDQWFLAYGDACPQWREKVIGHVKNEDGEGFNAYSSETANSIERTLGWMNQWAVTRQFGLGTKLPWDKSQLVESLSDSTIYMSYYTIAHYLHSDIFGSKPGLANIPPSSMSDEFWDYVFDLSDKAPENIPKQSLDEMRRSFKFWYPLDVRISGKDLLNNHLIFMLYIHQAIWGEKPEYLPRGIRANGHALMNGEKMSKSTGNFLTLEKAIEKYGADATRLAFADAGDGVEDANFEEVTANAAILKLYELRAWMKQVTNDARILKEGESFESVKASEKIHQTDVIQRDGEKNFHDKIFENELNILYAESVKQFSLTNYKAALKSGFWDFTGARDAYRVATGATGGMHRSCILRYIEMQTLLLAAITPHFSEYIWLEVLGKKETITFARYETVPAPDESLTAAMLYSRMVQGNIGSTEGAMLKKLGKGKGVQYDPKSDKKLTLYIASSYPKWQDELIALVTESLDGLTLDVKKIMPKIDKKNKKAMPFIMSLKQSIEKSGSTEVLDRKLAFNEVDVLKHILPSLKATVYKCKEIEIVEIDPNASELPPAAQSAVPGNPGIDFANV